MLKGKLIYIFLLFSCLSFGQSKMLLASIQQSSSTNFSIPANVDISGLVTYYDADVVSGNDGDPITTLTDLKSSNNAIGTATLNVGAGGRKDIEFNGTSDIFNVGQPASLDFTPGTDSFSIFWVVGEKQHTGQGFLVAKADDVVADRQYAYRVNNTDTDITVMIGGGTISTYNANATLVAGDVITMVVSSTNVILYINSTASGSLAIGSNTNSYDIILGAKRDVGNTGFDTYFDGSMRAVGFYNIALTPTQVSNIANEY